MARKHTHKFREMKERLTGTQGHHFSFSCLVLSKGVPLAPPRCPASTRQAKKSLMFSWAVMTALTAPICLRGQDERQPIKGCHLNEWEGEMMRGGGGRLDEQKQAPSWVKWIHCHPRPPLGSQLSVHPPTCPPLPPSLSTPLLVLVSSLIQYLQVGYSLSWGGTATSGGAWTTTANWSRGVRFDWQICPRRPFPSAKTQGTKRRKWRELNRFEYKCYTTGAVNNWEVLDYQSARQ